MKFNNWPEVIVISRNIEIISCLNDFAKCSTIPYDCSEMGYIGTDHNRKLKFRIFTCLAHKYKHNILTYYSI